MTPRVSVLMAVYNNAKELPRALAGLRSQRFDDFEVVAINDGSVDGSGALLDQVAAEDRRFRVIHQSNCGLMRALRRACEEARGEFWARQDGDDVSGPDRLARQVAYLDGRPQVVACGCWSYHVPPDGARLQLQSVPDQSAQLLGYLESGWNPFVHGSMMFRAEAYHRLSHGYRLAPYCEDFDLWLQMSQVGLLGMIAEVQYAWWLTPGGMSARNRAMQAPLLALALQLHRERKVLGAEQTNPDEAVARILQQQAAVSSPSHHDSFLVYADAISALRAGEYVRYRALMRELTKVGGPWATRARVRHVLGWLAPLIRLAYFLRERPTPLHYVRRAPPGTPAPAWLATYLSRSSAPGAGSL